MCLSEGLLTVKETAEYLRISDKSVRRLIENNKLKASKVGDRHWRIKMSDIEEYLQSRSNGAQQESRVN